MFGLIPMGMTSAILEHNLSVKERQKAQATLSPEEFAKWEDRRREIRREVAIERRHREMCAAIIRAGKWF